MCVCVCLATPQDEPDAGFNNFYAEFSFFLAGGHAKVKKPSLSYYLLIAGGRIVGFICFLKVLALWEKQTAVTR